MLTPVSLTGFETLVGMFLPWMMVIVVPFIGIQIAERVFYAVKNVINPSPAPVDPEAFHDRELIGGTMRDGKMTYRYRFNLKDSEDVAIADLD